MENTAAVANYFLSLARRDNIEVSHMKLQKLLYYAHGWYLALKEEPLLDDPIQAVRYGVWIMSVYSFFINYGNNSISSLLMPDLFYELYPEYPEIKSPFAKNLVEKVWDIYKPFSAIVLASMSTMSGSPWDTTRKFCDKNKRMIEMSDEIIMHHFKQLYKTIDVKGENYETL